MFWNLCYVNGILTLFWEFSWCKSELCIFGKFWLCKQKICLISIHKKHCFSKNEFDLVTYIISGSWKKVLHWFDINKYFVRNLPLCIFCCAYLFVSSVIIVYICKLNSALKKSSGFCFVGSSRHCRNLVYGVTNGPGSCSCHCQPIS